MKMKFVLSTLFILLYGVFVLALMPAKWVMNQITLPQNISFVNVTGTLWQTDIARVVIDGIEIRQVQSSLSAASLLALEPVFDINFGTSIANQSEGKFQLSGLLSAITIENAKITVPADIVISKLNLAIEVQAHNQLELDVEHYVVGKPVCVDLSGQLNWRKATITALDNTISLGKLSVNLACEKGELVADVDPENNLGLSYKALIKAGGRFAGSGYLKPGAKFPRQLREVLGFLGTPDSQGRYRLGR